MTKKTKDTRFKEILSRYTINHKTQCWEFNGARDSSGYGCAGFFGKIISTHRLSFMFYKGNIPKDLYVLHSCDNPICINPDHLSVGSQKQNMSQASLKKRTAWGNRSNRTRFTKSFVLKIRSEFTGKFGDMTKIARKYNELPSTIRRLIKKERWAHL